MGLTDFDFHSVWTIPADPDRIYAILRDVGNYPVWWPQVRRVVELGDDFGELHIRSRLPKDVVFTVARAAEDPVRRLLRARMAGDLTGWSQWQVHGDGDRASVEFRERVRVGGPVLRLGSVLARPVLAANHAAMMRAGERGLAGFVSR